MNKSAIPFACLFLITIHLANAQKASDIVQQMINKTGQLKSVTYVMKKSERIDGQIKEQKTFVKLQRKPFKVYNRQLSPKEGLEILYINGDETALINPNGFPWINIRLAPMGGRMTKGQHHTIFDSGFDCFVSIMAQLLNKYGTEINSMTKVHEVTDKQKRNCWILEFKNKYFEYIDYSVKENETVLSVAEKYKLSAYMIMKLNPELDEYDDIYKGQLIKIPNDYAPRLILHIDKVSFAPLLVQVYDDKGLYEQYEYYDVKLNPSFELDEFTAEYANYDF